MYHGAVANGKAVCRTYSAWIWYAVGVLILAVPVMLTSDCGIVGSSKSYHIKETDPAGTVILETLTSFAQWSVETWPEVVASFLMMKSDGGSPPSYNLSLHRSIDLEEMRDKHGSRGFTFSLYLICKPPEGEEKKIEASLEVLPVNEFRPKFNTTNIEIYIEEGVTDIVTLYEWASDKDFEGLVRNIQFFEFVAPKSDLLKMSPFRGKVTAKRPLDYDQLPETRKYIRTKVRVVDGGNKDGFAYLTIHLINVDDLPPRFIIPDCMGSNCTVVAYEAQVDKNFTGILSDIRPAQIMAEDMDQLAPRIIYRIVIGPPGFRKHIKMDLNSGIVRITEPLDPLLNIGSIEVAFIVQATEVTPKNHSENTILKIMVGKGITIRPKIPTRVPLYIVAITIVGVVIVLICATATCVGAVVRTGRMSARNSAHWKSESYMSTEDTRSSVVSADDIIKPGSKHSARRVVSTAL